MRRLFVILGVLVMFAGSVAPAEAHTRRKRRVRRHAQAAPSHSQQQVIGMIRAIWPDDSEERAIRIARCESQLNPNARNPRSSATGVFQVLASTHGAHARRLGMWPLTDPEKNIRFALELHRRSGFRPWVCKG